MELAGSCTDKELATAAFFSGFGSQETSVGDFSFFAVSFIMILLFLSFVLVSFSVHISLRSSSPGFAFDLFRSFLPSLGC